MWSGELLYVSLLVCVSPRCYDPSAGKRGSRRREASGDSFSCVWFQGQHLSQILIKHFLCRSCFFSSFSDGKPIPKCPLCHCFCLFQPLFDCFVGFMHLSLSVSREARLLLIHKIPLSLGQVTSIVLHPYLWIKIKQTTQTYFQSLSYIVPALFFEYIVVTFRYDFVFQTVARLTNSL